MCSNGSNSEGKYRKCVNKMKTLRRKNALVTQKAEFSAYLRINRVMIVHILWVECWIRRLELHKFPAYVLDLLQSSARVKYFWWMVDDENRSSFKEKESEGNVIMASVIMYDNIWLLYVMFNYAFKSCNSRWMKMLYLCVKMGQQHHQLNLTKWA